MIGKNVRFTKLSLNALCETTPLAISVDQDMKKVTSVFSFLVLTFLSNYCRSENVGEEQRSQDWQTILAYTIKESIRTMVLRTSTWTLLLFCALILAFSGILIILRKKIQV